MMSRLLKKKTGLYEVGHNEGEKAKTIEFDNVRSTIDKYQRNRYSYEEPYLKNEDKEKIEEREKLRREEELARREQERKRIGAMKLNNPKTVMDMENEPAYLRRRVYLDDTPHSSDEEISRWTISEDEEPELRSDNSFLHDNVD